MGSPAVSRRRNLSPWAYWQLRLASAPAGGPIATTASERESLRAQVRTMLGPDPQRVEPDVEITDVVDCGSYRRERIVFDAEDAMSVPAYRLVPHDRVAPGPAVLAIHGHGPGKRQICGLDAGVGAFGHDVAAAGYVVLAPDLRCFGERTDPQWDSSEYKYDCDWNLVCAVMAGVNPLAQNLWDLRVALDVMSSDPLVDPARIGACGFSYGGTSALYLTALDERVRAAVVSGYLSSWAAAHRVPWNMCGSQIMWGQQGVLEHAQLASLVTPRPLLIESGADDPLFPVAVARQTLATVSALWDAAGTPDALVHDVFDGEHRWNGVLVEEFFDRHL